MPDTPPPRRRAGRPPINPDTVRNTGGRNRSAPFTFNPGPGQMDRVDALAARLATSKAALLRRFVEEGLAREEALLGITPPPDRT